MQDLSGFPPSTVWNMSSWRWMVQIIFLSLKSVMCRFLSPLIFQGVPVSWFWLLLFDGWYDGFINMYIIYTTGRSDYRMRSIDYHPFFMPISPCCFWLEEPLFLEVINTWPTPSSLSDLQEGNADVVQKAGSNNDFKAGFKVTERGVKGAYAQTIYCHILPIISKTRVLIESYPRIKF